MNKSIWLLAIILLVFLLVYALLPQIAVPLKEDDVKRLLLNDLFKQGISKEEIQVLELRKEDDKWTSTVMLSRNPHSACPTVEKREYSDVLRFKYRPEALITNCNLRTPIVLREEALINSGKLDAVASVVGGGAYGCAFYLKNLNETLAREYCPLLDADAFSSFASDLPENSWVIQWRAGDKTVFVALDPYNTVLKTR